MSNGTTPTLLQQIEALAQQDFVTDCLPDIEGVLQIVATSGIDGLLTVDGQAQFMKMLVSLEADAIKAGHDLSAQIAQLLLTYLQGKFAKTLKPKTIAA